MNLLQRMRDWLIPQPSTVQKDQVVSALKSNDQAEILKKFGVVSSDLKKLIDNETLVNYERSQLYTTIDRSMAHPLMSAACGMYADVACNYSRQENATVWVTAKSREYQAKIEKMLEIINIEEVIYDWCWSVANTGDLFVRIHGEPGVGICSVSDDHHPIDTSRVDYSGRLIGFYDTPQGYAAADEKKLLPPYEYVHFRLLGAKRRRPMYQDSQYCLKGDTKIKLLNGTSPTIEDMAKDSNKFVGQKLWSVNPNTKELEVDEIESIQKTRLNADLVRVYIDNGTYIDCTPDHHFMLRDGTFKEAQLLVSNDRLMPLYSVLTSNKKYVATYNIETQRYKPEHILVAEKTIGRSLYENEVVHHVDFNGFNNSPENLKVMTKRDHMNLHWWLARLHNEKWENPEWRTRVSQKISKTKQEFKIKNPELFKKRCLSTSNSMKEVWSNGVYRDKTCSAIKEGQTKTYNNKEYWKSSKPRIDNFVAFRQSPINSVPIGKKIGEAKLQPKSKAKWLNSMQPYFDSIRKHPKTLVCTFCSAEFPFQLQSKGHPQRYCSTKCYWADRKIKNEVPVYLNHRVLKVERLVEKADTYDLTIKKNHNFATAAGVFVHNSEYRTINIMAPDIRQLTSKYGTSVLTDALPIYKRLRLAEDSLMLARLTRGQLKYLYKIGVGVNNSNNEAIGNVIDNYVDVLKRARCCRGDTEIALLDGTSPTIQSMAEAKDQYIGKYVYSINPVTKAVEPDKIINVAKTLTNTNIVRVHLDNSKWVDVTPDHPFMLRNGMFKEAKDLLVGESLMPLYLSKAQGGYQSVYNPKTNNFELVHVLISESVNGVLPKNHVIHHGKGNKSYFDKLNNDPSNLSVVSRTKHAQIHNFSYIGMNAIKLKKVKGKWHSTKGQTKLNHPGLAERSRKLTTIMKRKVEEGSYIPLNSGLTKENSPKMREISNKMKIINPTSRPEYRNFISKLMQTRTGNAANRWNPALHILEVRTCRCGKTFECPTISDRKYCKSSCAFKFQIRTKEHGLKISKVLTGFKHSVETKKLHSKLMLGNSYRKGKQKTLTTLNHKVVGIEWLTEKVDTYDITTERNHNFALTNGIFVHNSMDISQDNPQYGDKYNAMSAMEDLILPVWGDVNQLQVDRIGGDVDIKWIVDIEEWRNQLATALKVPLPILAGYADKANGGLGQNSLERLDIRFARQARRIQRAVINGLTRMAQIHLAYQGINPDLNQFEIHMAETSTAEEEELKDALDKGVDVVTKLADYAEKMFGPDLNKKELFDYLNTKFLKLNDFDLEKILLKGNANAFNTREETLVPGIETPGPVSEVPPTPEGETETPVNEPNPFRENRMISDFRSALPHVGNGKKLNESEWHKKWGSTIVKIEPINEKK